MIDPVQKALKTFYRHPDGMFYSSYERDCMAKAIEVATAEANRNTHKEPEALLN
jgi:hypothetical protein